MPINTSRYRRSTEWAGPKTRAPKPSFASATDWRRRFYILLVLSVLVLVVLGGTLAFVLLKNRPTKTSETSQTTSDTSDVSSWKKSENASVKLTFLYPPDWKLTSNKTQSDLDLLNTQVAGTGSTGSMATVKIDVIKDATNLSLADWVKQFGPKDIETSASTVVGESALLAKFSNSETGEEQNVYYVLKDSNVYVFDLYQSAKDETLKKELADFMENVRFEASSQNPSNVTPPSSTTSITKTDRIVINTVGAGFEDVFSQYRVDASGKALDFDDKDEDVYLKGNAEVYNTQTGSHVLVGYFGKSGTTSKDGIYSVEWDDGKKLTQIVSGVEPGLVRVSRNGGTIGYLNGAKGVSKKIILVDASGKSVDAITSSKAIQYFALSPDGLKVAYVTTGSSEIIIATRDNDAARTLGGFTTSNIYAFDWNEIGESGDAFVYVADGAKFSAKSELYFITSEGKSSIADATPKRLTSDSVAQDNPRFNSDGTKIAYQSYTSGTSGKASVWVMGIDGKNDTNIVKSGNNAIAGWISIAE